MPPSLAQRDIDQLSVPERLELIARLWDSVPESLEALPVPESHRRALEQRLAAADTAPEWAIPWEQLKTRLREKPMQNHLIFVAIPALRSQDVASLDRRA